MRDYGKVAPTFWTGTTGRALRKFPEAQTVALYLMTSPHATMLGIFQCPIAYIAHETGLPSEGASKGLHKLLELGFCSFDENADLVWVHEMARFQIGEALKEKDKRVTWLNREFQTLPSSPLISAFLERYGVAFCLSAGPNQCPTGSPSGRAFPSPSPSQSKAKQEQKKEDAAPPPDGGSAHPPQSDPPSSPASSSNGASSSGRGRPAADRVDDAVKRAEAEEVLADRDASDEDRFFALRYRLADKGVAWSRAMQLLKLHEDEGFHPVVAALDKTLRARDPSTYLGKVVSERRTLLRDEAGEPEPPRRTNGAHAKEPQFVREYREDGWDVAADGPNRWIIAGQIYDETGEVIGW